MATTDPADDTTGIVEAVHREAARLRAEDEQARFEAVFNVIDGYQDDYNIIDRSRMVRAILAALDGVSP